MYEKKVYLLEKAVIVKSLTTDFSAHVCAFYFLRHVRSLLNCLENKGAAKQKGGPPYFFFAPSLAGGCEKKSGVRKERGVHAPRAPPLSTLLQVYE